MRNIFLTLCVSAALLFSSACAPPLEQYRIEFYGLFNTNTVLTGYAENQTAFDRYADIVFTRMDRLHQLYDIYHAYENLNNLYTVNENAGAAPVKVDREIIDLLLLAKEAYVLSGGMVNAAMGPVLRLWHTYRSEGLANPESAALPPMAKLRAAAQHINIDDVVIDEAESTVFLRHKGMSLDVGAIAKAYAADIAVKEAREAGLTSALLNAGGNITAVGRPLDGGREHWAIGVTDPALADDASTQHYLDVVNFSDRTISCSGAYQRYYTVGGEDYGHIIDPLTLMPPRLYQQIAVIHPSAGMSDILSTALFLMPLAQGMALAEQCGAEAFWIGIDGKWEATEGYKAVSREWL